MAHIETWYICEACKAAYSTKSEAQKCAVSHVYSEKWAISHTYPGKAVKVLRNRSEAQALKEAEMKDT